MNPLQFIEDECGHFENYDTTQDNENLLESFNDQSIHTVIENATFDSNQ